MTWILDDAAPAYATHNSSSTTWNPFTLTIPAGRFLFVAVTISETPAATISIDKPGGETNDWVTLARFQPAGGGASQHTRLFMIKTSVAWNHPITATFSVAKVVKIANWISFTGGSLVPRTETDNDAGDAFEVVQNGPLPFPSIGSISGISGTFTWAGQSEGREGDLFVGFQTGGVTIPTLDSDTTNGTWVDAGNAAAATVSGADGDIAMRMSYKLITGRGTQELNNPGGLPVGGAILIPQETAHVLTQGGDIDSTTADPAWFFRTSAAAGDVLRFAMQAGDLLIGGTMSKPDESTVGTPTGYTKFGSKIASNADTAVNAYEKTAVGTEGAKIVVPVTSPDGLGSGSMLRLRGGVGILSDWETECVFGADNTTSGTIIDITADNSITVQPGDKVVYFLAVSFHDPATSIALGGFTGCTIKQYDLAYNGFTTDPDGGINVGYVEIDDTPGSVPVVVTPTLTASYNSGASAAPAAFVLVRYLLPPPDLPQDVACGEATSTSVSVNWEPPPVGEFDPTYYEVRIESEDPVNVGLDLDHTFTGLDSNTTYALYVRACNDSQCSEWVEVDCSTCPPVPVNLTAEDITQTEFTLCWQAGS